MNMVCNIQLWSTPLWLDNKGTRLPAVWFRKKGGKISGILYLIKYRGWQYSIFCFWQQIPWKDQNQQCISADDTFWLPQVSVPSSTGSYWRRNSVQTAHSITFKKRVINFLKQLGTIVFSKRYSSMQVYFGFGALVSIYGSRMACAGLT